jgi:hypothetical protein
MTYEEKKAYEEAYLRKFLENGRSLHTESLEYAIFELTKELESRKKNKREKLRQELVENLQKAIGGILNNGFNLTIENVNNPNWVIQLLSDEIYHIEIE